MVIAMRTRQALGFPWLLLFMDSVADHTEEAGNFPRPSAVVPVRAASRSADRLVRLSRTWLVGVLVIIAIANKAREGFSVVTGSMYPLAVFRSLIEEVFMVIAMRNRQALGFPGLLIGVTC